MENAAQRRAAFRGNLCTNGRVRDGLELALLVEGVGSEMLEEHAEGSAVADDDDEREPTFFRSIRLRDVVAAREHSIEDLFP